MRYLSIAIAGLIVAVHCGCEAAAPPQTAEKLETAPSPPPPAAPAEPAVAESIPTTTQRGKAQIADVAAAARAKKAAEDESGDMPADAASDPPAPDAAPPDSAPPADDELSAAEVGVGVKGKDYGGPGFVTTPIETMFTIEERIAFDVQIPNSMKIYKAAHDNKGPASHEEFMDIIIKENAVQLPDLPPGSVYWYDAKSEQLMVRTPKPDAGSE